MDHPVGADREGRERCTDRLTGGLLLAAVAALALALRVPLATTVLGLVAFGVLHNALELRYVTGRFAGVLSGRFLGLLVALVSGIVLCRVAALIVGTPARYAEIVIGYAVLAAAVAACAGRGAELRGSGPPAACAGRRAELRGPGLPAACAGRRAELRGPGLPLRLRGWSRPVALVVLALAASASLRWPAYHFVVLAHLHNVVPLVFLWEWARRLPTAAARAGFRTVQVGWVLVVPALILAGLADRWTGPVASGVAAFAGDPARVLAVSAPPSTVDSTLGVRFLVVFAFLQTMHYVVWVWFLPRYAPDATAAFERRVPALTGRRVWALGLAGGAVLAVLFVLDYAGGRSVYAALATYHAYLEFPVLLALLLAAVGETPTGVRDPAISRPGGGGPA